MALERLAVQAQAVQLQALAALAQQIRVMPEALAVGPHRALMLAVAAALEKLARQVIRQRVAMVWPALSLVAL